MADKCSKNNDVVPKKTMHGWYQMNKHFAI